MALVLVVLMLLPASPSQLWSQLREDGFERDLSDPFANSPESETGFEEGIYDPIEPVNRTTFAFNDWFYLNLLQPTVKGYVFVTPDPFRNSVGNFFENLQEPVNFVNSLLQSRGSDAHNAFGRFVINTTFGLGGLIDVAGQHLDRKPHDFNETLDCWGIGDGFYIVWPIIGSSSLRDAGSGMADSLLEPTYYTGFRAALAAKSLEGINSAGPYLEEYVKMKGYSLDAYTALKDVYESTNSCDLESN